jgi:hypothetical protein
MMLNDGLKLQPDFVFIWAGGGGEYVLFFVMNFINLWLKSDFI